jgi:hypothetical protein
MSCSTSSTRCGVAAHGTPVCFDCVRHKVEVGLKLSVRCCAMLHCRWCQALTSWRRCPTCHMPGHVTAGMTSPTLSWVSH